MTCQGGMAAMPLGGVGFIYALHFSMVSHRHAAALTHGLNQLTFISLHIVVVELRRQVMISFLCERSSCSVMGGYE